MERRRIGYYQSGALWGDCLLSVRFLDRGVAEELLCFWSYSCCLLVVLLFLRVVGMAGIHIVGVMVGFESGKETFDEVHFVSLSFFCESKDGIGNLNRVPSVALI